MSNINQINIFDIILWVIQIIDIIIQLNHQNNKKSNPNHINANGPKTKKQIKQIQNRLVTNTYIIKTNFKICMVNYIINKILRLIFKINNVTSSSQILILITCINLMIKVEFHYYIQWLKINKMNTKLISVTRLSTLEIKIQSINQLQSFNQFAQMYACYYNTCA